MTNLLTNSGFDNNATSWIRFGSTEYVTGPDARSNQTCIKMIANPLGNESTISGIRQFFTAEPGKSYVLSFWGKGTKDLRINWSWRFTNAQNSWWGYGYNSGMLVEADESSYRRFTHQFIFPADMLSTQVAIELYTSGAKIGDRDIVGNVFIDDVEVYEQDFLSDPAHPAGADYTDDPSFEMMANSFRDYGKIVDPLNAQTGYAAIKLVGSYSQYVPLLQDTPVGNAYLASFFAKSSVGSKVCLRYSYFDSEGNHQIKTADYTPTLTCSYQRYEIRFRIPWGAQRCGNIYFSVFPTSSGNEAWVDDIKVVQTTPFLQNNFVMTTIDNVNLRSEPNTSSTRRTLAAKGSTLLIDGYTDDGQLYNGSTRWVRVKWCSFDNNVFTPDVMYMHESYAEEVNNTSSAWKNQIVTKIAESLVDTTGANLDLKGEWCQTFLYWLCYVSGVNITASDLPVSCGVTADAVAALENSGLYKSREEYPNYLPYVGNWIYYRNVGSNDSVSHVGLVVKGPTSSSNKIECVEGNLGSASNPTSLPVRRITIDDYTAQTVTVRGQEKYILGFAPIIYM